MSGMPVVPMPPAVLPWLISSHGRPLSVGSRISTGRQIRLLRSVQPGVESVTAEDLVDEEVRDHFIFLAPSCGTMNRQVIDEDQAMIDFHQAVTGVRDVIVYPPDQDGWYKVIFAVVMRASPSVRVEPVDLMLDVEVEDADTDHRLRKAKVRFRFRDRRTRAVVKHAVPIRVIELDAEI